MVKCVYTLRYHGGLRVSYRWWTNQIKSKTKKKKITKNTYTYLLNILYNIIKRELKKKSSRNRFPIHIML